jgi:hypothetical protein
MALTETWLKSHKDAEVGVDGFKIFRADRKRKKKGPRGRLSGGVAAYVHDDIASHMENVLDYSNGVVEILGLYSRIDNLFLAIVYRQPDDTIGGNRSTDSEFKPALDKLSKVLSDLGDPQPNTIICGDFNLPHLSWQEATSTFRTGAPSYEKAIFELLSKFMDEHFLKQQVLCPTHIAGNTLDLVFTNNNYLLHSYDCLKPLTSVSDHFVVEACTAFKAKSESCEEAKPEYLSPLDKLNFYSNDINWDIINEELSSSDWVNELSNLHPSDKLTTFMQKTEAACNKHIPLRKSVHKSGQPKIPRERRILMRKRRKITLKLKNAQSSVTKEKLERKLTNIELALQNSHQNSMSMQEMKAINAIKTNPKYFYSYAKKFSKTKSKIGPLLDENNEYTSSSKKMADILSKQYQSVFSEPMPQSIYTNAANVTNNLIEDINFDEEDIINAIDEFSTNSSSGPDGLATILLKKCKRSVSKPLFLLWRSCLDEGITPEMLKIAHIIPIHKGGHQGLPSNYRPIALTSLIIKLFEKIVRTNIVEYLDGNNLLNKSQHGFRKARSCVSQLLDHYDKILTLLESGFNVDTIYLDFAKAFDKVDHAIVLEKLSLLGIKGKLLGWIKSFLTDRTQYVIVNGFLSEPCKVLSGVPQGSVIGPLLFLVLIGDIDVAIKSSFLSSFADDTRVGKGIKNLNDANDLQCDLQTVFKWAFDNNMKFNNTKFELLQYGLNVNLKETTNYYGPDGTQINSKTHVKDLGVTMSNNGTFSEQINKICQSARDMCSWILRTFKSRSPDLMKITWRSLVLPILDYCSQLWCPIKPGQIKQLESIQQSFTRKIKADDSYNYWERLSNFKMYSLQRRRERYRILYVWKILESHVPNISCEGNCGIKKLHSPRNGRTCSNGLLIIT